MGADAGWLYERNRLTASLWVLTCGAKYVISKFLPLWPWRV